MPSFYCLHESYYPGIAERLGSLKKACHKKGVEFHDIDCSVYSRIQLPELSRTDMMYNVGRGGEEMENLVLNKDIKTFYRNNPPLVINNRDTVKYSLLHSKLKIPSPKTIFHTTNNAKLLEKYVNHIGGFPIVLKTCGGTRGVGAVYISDSKNLKSLADLLVSLGEDFILREYIEPKEIARLIVIGDEVIASNSKKIPPGDFRSSVESRLPEPKIYNRYTQDLAIRAAHSANFLNCGVDILIDKSNRPFVLEVNMPHDFVTSEKATGIDISGAMIDLLLSK